MKKIKLIALLTCSWAGWSFGQPQLQKLAGGFAADEASQLIHTADGGFATIGTTESYGAGGTDVLFVKYDGLLNVQWARAYGSAGNDYGTSCLQLPNGNYMLSGYTYGLSQDTLFDDVLVIRITGTGIVLWAKTAGGDGFDESEAMDLTTDFYVVLAGRTTSSFQPSLQAGYALKFGQSGNMVWDKAYYTDSVSYFKSVTAAAAGGATFAGACNEQGSLTEDIYTVKADTNGSIAWGKRYGGVADEAGNGIKRLSTSDFMITGTTSSYGAGATDAFLLKLDSSGNARWLNTYGSADYEKGNAVVENTGGWYIFCGNADTTFNATGNSMALAIKADTSGGLLNRKAYGDSIGNSVSNSLLVAADSGFVFAGKTESFGAADTDIYLMKSDNILKTGCYQTAPVIAVNTYAPAENNAGTAVPGGTSLVVTSQIITTAVALNQHTVCIETGIGEEAVLPVRVFPNPASEILTVDLSEMKNEPVTVLLKTIKGQTVYSSISFMNRMVSIGTGNFSCGLYILQITSGKGTRFEKISVVK